MLFFRGLTCWCCFALSTYFYIIFCIFTLPLPTPHSQSVSLGVGVKGTAFPVGTVKSLTRGSNQTQTSKWWVSSSSLPIRPELVSGGWFLSHPHRHFWAGVPRREPTRLSWKGWDNETLWGQQRHLPLLSVTSLVQYVCEIPNLKYSMQNQSLDSDAVDW